MPYPSLPTLLLADLTSLLFSLPLNRDFAHSPFLLLSPHCLKNSFSPSQPLSLSHCHSCFRTQAYLETLADNSASPTLSPYNSPSLTLCLFPQFRFLRSLMFVHGRFTYRRMSLFSYYMFYKYNVLALVLVFYTFTGLFSANRLYIQEPPPPPAHPPHFTSILTHTFPHPPPSLSPSPPFPSVHSVLPLTRTQCNAFHLSVKFH